MGSCCILIIGDNWRQQVERFRYMEYADPVGDHVKEADILAESRVRYERDWEFFYAKLDGTLVKRFTELDPVLIAGLNEHFVGKSAADIDSAAEDYVKEHLLPRRIKVFYKSTHTFEQWGKLKYSATILLPGQQPDFWGAHRHEFIRLNEGGEIMQWVWRNVPDGFFDYIKGTAEAFRLKPGTQGWDLAPERDEIIPTFGTVAGAARKGDVDWQTMREKINAARVAQWDYVNRVAAERTWVPFAQIRAKYPKQGETYDASIETAASTEWSDQPPIKEMRMATIFAVDAPRDYTPVIFDDYLLPREAFIAKWAKERILWCSDVVRHGKLITQWNEDELLASIADDEMLTMVVVKC